MAETKKIEAILFDLDGTLLDIDMNLFVPYYLTELAEDLFPDIPPNEFVEKVMQAAYATMANNEDKLLLNVFSDVFTQMIDRPWEEIENLFRKFYLSKLKTLTRYTKQKPEAHQVMQQAFELGLDVVIATIPLFLREAVDVRLEWAGISEFPYTLVTTLENCYASKPNLKYYEAIFKKVGHPAESCLMVGDEDMDMVAGRLGCSTFLIQSRMTNLDATTPDPTYRGTLADLLKFLLDLK